MSGRPRKGHRVVFQPEDDVPVPQTADPITGLRFTITAQHGGEALVDYTGLRPRRLALAFARALRHLAAPGGPLGVRSTVKAYAVTLPKFFDYLQEGDTSVDGPDDLRGHHVDGFETWLEAGGYSRVNLFTVLVKVVAVLRQVTADMPNGITPIFAIACATSAASLFSGLARGTLTVPLSRASFVMPPGTTLPASFGGCAQDRRLRMIPSFSASTPPLMLSLRLGVCSMPRLRHGARSIALVAAAIFPIAGSSTACMSNTI